MDKVKSIAAFSNAKLDLKSFKLDNAFHYKSLPLCVIDSVFSIGVRYEGVKNVINNFCSHTDITPLSNNDRIPPINEQYSVAKFMSDYGRVTPEIMASEVYKNKQRTSTRSGILKAHAVQLFIGLLHIEDVNYYQDLSTLPKDFESRIALIPGQSSGISLKYFYMLAGAEDLIKPDRMIIRYLENITKDSVSMDMAQELLTAVCVELKTSHGITITPRTLDNAIWEYQRAQ